MGIDSIRKSHKVIKLAIWIKENAHSLREIALIFFALALFAGVIWISGRDVEPIVYVLGAISTILFASPSISRYVIPDRKPVRDMSYDELLGLVLSSNPKLDWQRIDYKETKQAFLKEDPRLRIRVRYDEEGMCVNEFNEPWATRFPDSMANSYWYDLFYYGDLIHRFVLVSVQDGRVRLPQPNLTSHEIDPLSYKVAQIFDKHNTLDEYIDKSGLILRNS